MRYPLVETINPFAFSFQKPLDMKTRGPKVMSVTTLAWSPEHEQEAKRFAEARELARRLYGRS